jgi:hypothetical protein
MAEILTLKEIYQRFDSEWVLLGNHETDENLAVKRGEVLHHSKDRDEVYRKAVELRPKRCAFLFTGSIPEGTAVIL